MLALLDKIAMSAFFAVLAGFVALYIPAIF